MNNDDAAAADDSRPPPSERETFRIPNVLQRIAAGFNRDSQEEEALRHAAAAWIVVSRSRELLAAVKQLTSGDSLTPAMRAALRARGIDPDDPTLGDTELT